MSHQLLSNDQGLRLYAEDRRRQLLKEAEQERLARLAQPDSATITADLAALVPIGVAVAALIGAAVALA